MISKGIGGKSVHDGLPTYSNTCDIYFKKGEDGLACQAKLYKGRRSVLDFDWDHNHTNADGSKFEAGTVHVQVYKVDNNGNLERMSKYARRTTSEEVKKYGRFAVIQSLTKVRLQDFIHALTVLGARDALYLDMGGGWNYGWYRETTASPAVELFHYRTPYQTNWLVVRAR